MTIRVLLADDNPIFVTAVRQFLSTLPATEVVGVAHNGRDAIAWAESLAPDLTLLDIGMPELNGLEAEQHMQTCARWPNIVFLSMHDGQAYRDATQQAGASGFISKSDFVAELPRLIAATETRMRQSAT